MEWYKYSADKIIGQFTSTNETFSKSVFDKYCGTRASGCPKQKLLIISALNSYKLNIPKTIRIGTMHLVYILPL